jgi:hypothetical protein
MRTTSPPLLPSDNTHYSYAEKYDEEFAPHFPTFLKEVVALLMVAPQSTRFDQMVINGLSFLSQARRHRVARALSGAC